jgi:O-methyltransferase
MMSATLKTKTKARGIALARRVLRPTPKTPPWLRRDNVLTMALGFSMANNVIGDYLEFGVWQGESFIHAYQKHERALKAYRRVRTTGDTSYLHYQPRYFAFDSFEGFPDVDESELPLHWRGAQAYSTPQAEFEANLRAAKVDLERVTVVPGYYNDVLTPELRSLHRLERGAVIHVDCDLYESTVDVLDFVAPMVVDGTVMVFDDWFYYKGNPRKGQQRAYRDWLDQRPDWTSTPLFSVPSSAAFIVNIPDVP